MLTGRGDGVTAVTADGDVFAPGVVRGGSAVRAQPDRGAGGRRRDPRSGLEDAARRGEQARFGPRRGAGAPPRQPPSRSSGPWSGCTSPTPGWRRSPSGSASSAPRPARRAAEAERTEQAVVAAERALVSDREELAALQQRLDDASAEPGEEEPSTDERDRLEQAATAARAVRDRGCGSTLRTREERARAMAGRADSLESAARSELAARERAAARRERRRREAAVAEAVRAGRGVRRRAGGRLAGAGHARRGRRPRRPAPSVRRLWPACAGEISTLGDELRELTDSVHRDEVARTEQRLRIEALQAKAVEELGIDPDVLVEEFGPHQLVPPSCPTPR